MADPERRLWERSIFKEVPQFLKSNRISLAYGLTSNKHQTFIRESCFASSYIDEHVDFGPFLGGLGGMNAFGHFVSAIEGHGSPPSVKRYMCIPPEL